MTTALAQLIDDKEETQIVALIEQLDHCGMDDASVQHECKAIRDIILRDSRGKDLR